MFILFKKKTSEILQLHTRFFFLSEEINVEGKCGQEKFNEAMDEAGKQNVGY